MADVGMLNLWMQQGCAEAHMSRKSRNGKEL
jgi:hypothetical protein